MLKNALKFSVIALLFLCVVSIAIFGFQFADYDLPGLFSPNSVMMNREFGGGTSLYLAFPESDTVSISTDDYANSEKIIKERFINLGYTDVETSVVDKLIRVDVSTKTYLDELVGKGAAQGAWSLKTYATGATVCTATMVSEASVSADGTGITLKFTEEGATKFYANTASLASTNPYLVFSVDGEDYGVGTITQGSISDSFTFSLYNANIGQFLASVINNGELPLSMEIEKTEPFDAKFNGGVLIAIIAVEVLILAAFAVVFFLFGKKLGIFALLTVISNIAIFVIMLLNKNYLLDLATLVLMTLCVIASALTCLKAIIPLGKALKAGKELSSKEISALNKFSIRFTWINVILLIIAIITLFLVRQATLIIIIRVILTFVCANFASFFAFFYCGTRCLASSKK